jgi:hypothetical protein
VMHRDSPVIGELLFQVSAQLGVELKKKESESACMRRTISRVWQPSLVRIQQLPSVLYDPSSQKPAGSACAKLGTTDAT